MSEESSQPPIHNQQALGPPRDPLETGVHDAPRDADIAPIEVQGPERVEGSTTVQLDTLAPLVDTDEFHERTGLFGNLLATVQVGNSAVGIIDRKSFLRDKNLPPQIKLMWGTNAGGHAFTKKEDVHAVILTPAGDVQRDQRGRPLLFPLKSEQTLIVGRAADNDIAFGVDHHVSRRHANIAYDEQTGQLTVTDRESKNGTFLEAHPKAVVPESRQPKGDTEWWSDAVDAAESIVDQRPPQSVQEYVYNGELPPRYFQVGVAEKALKGEDASLADRDSGLYGVFDGAGGHEGAATASHTASLRFAEVMTKLKPEASLADVQEVMQDALREASAAAGEGVTTATVVKITRQNGKEFVTWANVGDSRLYVYSTDTRQLRKVSQDEGSGRYLYNALGNSNGRDITIEQCDSFELGPNDRLMLCSDGITGDYEDDILSDAEISSVLQAENQPEIAANNFLKLSRKRDDKTCIVIA